MHCESGDDDELMFHIVRGAGSVTKLVQPAGREFGDVNQPAESRNRTYHKQNV